MSHGDEVDLDRQLQKAVNADAASVERLVARALAAAPARHVPVGRLAAYAALVGVFATAIVLSWPPGPAPPDPIRMSNDGDVILVDYPDGSRAIIGPAKNDRGLFAEFDYVLVHGGQP